MAFRIQGLLKKKIEFPNYRRYPKTIYIYLAEIQVVIKER